MSDTPETEELAGKIDPSTLEHDAYATMLNHAVRLERERDEARKAAEKLRENEIGLTPEMMVENPNAHPRFPWEHKCPPTAK